MKSTINSFLAGLATAIAVILFFSSCGTSSVISDEDTSTIAERIERPIPYPIDVPAAYQRAVEDGTRTATGEPGPNYWQNFANYTITAELVPDEKRVNGFVRVQYYNNSPDDLVVIVLELAQNLHKEGTPKLETIEITGGVDLRSLAINGAHREEISLFQRWTQSASGYAIDGTRLYVWPDEELESGGVIELEIEWSFVVPQRGASGRMGHSEDNLFFIAYWYPQIAVYDDIYGWFDDSFLGNAEFYHGFANYDLTITAPANWLVMATGEFLNPDETLSTAVYERYNRAINSDVVMSIVGSYDFGKTTKEGEESIRWRFTSENVRDVAFSAVSQSKWDGARTPVGDLSGNGEPDYTHIHSFYRASAPLWRDQAEYAQHSITFLSDYLNLSYPWPHMTSVEGAGIIGGGMEFPMMTVIGNYNNAGPVALYGVTAHELAHMWFPMIISTNERRYSWIDEGNTTFNTHQARMDYWGGRFKNGDIFAGYTRIAGSDLEGPMMRWSDFHYPGPAFGVASYAKPASVMVALKGVLGEEVFMEAYHKVIERWAWKHPYPWDIFSTFEDVSGMDLSWFWRSWYYETWELDHAITDVIITGNRFTVHIEDRGKVVMPVHLHMQFEDGSAADVTLDIHEWMNGQRTTSFTMGADSPLISVQIDRNLNFPYVNRENLVWSR